MTTDSDFHVPYQGKAARRDGSKLYALCQIAAKMMPSLILLMALGSQRLVHSALHIVSPSDAVGLKGLLESAHPGDEVRLLAGIYQGAQNCNITVRTSNVMLRSESGPTETVIDCSGTISRHLTIVGSGITVIGIDFQNGSSLDASPDPPGTNVWRLPSGSQDALSQSAFGSVIGLSRDFQGGCLLILGSGFTVSNSRFTRCSAASNGGAISVLNAGRVQLTNLHITQSSSRGRGGGIWIQSSEVELAASVLLRNSAFEGGGIYMVGNEIEPAAAFAVNVTFIANSAVERPRAVGEPVDWSGSGGGIVADGAMSELRISGSSLLQENSALWMGGAVLGRAGAKIVIDESTTLSRNFVVCAGGAIALIGNGTAAIVTGTALITDNVARGSDGHVPTLPFTVGGLGGAVHASLGSSIAIAGDVLVAGNTGGLGAAIFLSSLNPFVRLQGSMSLTDFTTRLALSGNVLLSNNSARSTGANDYSGCGGGIYGSARIIVDISGSVILNNNSASQLGGALALEEGFRCSPIGGWDARMYPAGLQGLLGVRGSSTFSANRAQFGGCIFGASVSLNLTGSTVFVNNNAIEKGGVVLISAQSTIKVAENVQFRSNFARQGAVMYAELSSNVLAGGGARFEANVASTFGGAIYLNQSRLLASDNAIFLANRAVQGACIWGNAATASLSGRVRFEFNSASGNGGVGVFVAQSSLNISGNVVFHSNNASTQGGCFHATLSTVLITDTVSFVSNSVAGHRGGAIYILNSPCNLSGAVRFISNRAVQAGAIFISGAPIYITDFVIFELNKAITLGAVSGVGGAVWAETAQLIITEDVQFRSNFATIVGGALTLRFAPANITGRVLFYNNTALVFVTPTNLQGAGGALYASDSLRINRVFIGGNVVFDSNIASFGAAISLNNMLMTISDEVLFFNGSSQRAGGAIHVDSSVLNVTGDVRFYRNTVFGNGGAISATRSVSLRTPEVNIAGRVSFIENVARASRYNVGSGGYGGALYTTDMTSTGPRTLVIGGSVTVRNNSAIYGGAFGMFIGVIVFSDNSVVSDNVALDRGGAIFVQDDSLVIFESKTVFANNSAKVAGGAYFAYGGMANLSGMALFRNNTAPLGGAAYYNSSSFNTFCCVRLDGNSADDGGAIFSGGASLTRITNTNMTRNRAKYSGGALALTTTDRALIQASAFFENSANATAMCPDAHAPCGGGAVSISGASQLILKGGSVLEDNSAVDGGGVLVSGSATVSIQLSTLSRNCAAAKGGGIAVLQSASATLLDGTVLDGCFAAVGGGLFSNGENCTTIDGTLTFSNNRALTNGGGVCMFSPFYWTGASLVQFRNNTAADGGAIFAMGSTSLIVADYTAQASFNGNTARQNGGAIYFAEGAALKVKEEGCPPECQGRGNGECNPECLTRGCNWDDGDCTQQFRNAGRDANVPCDPSQCDQFAMVNFDYSGGCYFGCFNSSCDWNRMLCQSTRTTLATCPLFDLTVYDSMLADRRVSFMYGGISGGFGRCGNASACTAAVTGNSSDTPGRIGPGAFRFDGLNNWVDVSTPRELDFAVANTTIEVWVAFDGAPASADEQQMVLSTATIDVASAYLSDIGWHIALTLKLAEMPTSNCTERYLWNESTSPTWTHIAFAPGTDGIRTYVNGALVDSVKGGTCRPYNASAYALLAAQPFVQTPISLIAIYLSYRLYALRLGRNIDPLPPYALKGAVDAFRIWGSPRSAAQIATDLGEDCPTTVAAAAPADGLAVCWDFDQPYPTTIFDLAPQPTATNGNVVNSIIDQCDSAEVVLGFVLPSGFCAGSKPRLVGVGYDYEPADYLRVSQHIKHLTDLRQVLELAPTASATGQPIPPVAGCATRPLSFIGNRALFGHGGAVYQAGCDFSWSQRGLCSLIGSQSNGQSRLTWFEENEAGGAGGAIYTACDHVNEACSSAMTEILGIPGVSQHIANDKVQFKNNRALAYGNDLATAPYEMLVLPGYSTAAIPAQEPLNMTIMLLDGRGQQIRGSPVVPLELVAVSTLCPVSDRDCTLTTGLLPTAFHIFDSETGLCTTAPRQELRCQVGRYQVNARVSILGFQGNTRLSIEMKVGCLPCSAGQAKTTTQTGYNLEQYWYCKSCAPTQYVVDPNANECQNCPAGAFCNGASVNSTVPGSVWSEKGGLYELVGCPAGYFLQKSQQECFICPEVHYCPGGDGAPIQCPDGFFSPTGASFSNTCIEAVFVLVTVNVPIATQDFTDVLRENFRTALAEILEEEPRQVFISAVVRSSSELSTTVISNLATINANRAAEVMHHIQPNVIEDGLASFRFDGCKLTSLQVSACQAGYVLLSSQTCALCPANYYCEGGTAQRQPCPAGMFAVAGANSSKSCESAVFIVITFIVQLNPEAFISIQPKFIKAISLASGYPSERIIIVSVDSARRTGNLSLNCRVVTQIACRTQLEAGEASKSLGDLGALSLVLESHGFPKATINSLTVTGGSSSGTPTGASGSIIGGVTAGGLVLLIAVVYVGVTLIQRLRRLEFRKALVAAIKSGKVGDDVTAMRLPKIIRKHYSPVKILGIGAYGCVFKATVKDVPLVSSSRESSGFKKQDGGRKSKSPTARLAVAIKVIIPKAETFTQKEIRQLRREEYALQLCTEHKCLHAVQLAGLGATCIQEDMSTFIMELVQGENMATFMTNPEKSLLDTGECIKVARSVLAALKVMHAHGLLHRDIKPANIMRSLEGTYKLIDFGATVGVDEEKVVEVELMMTMIDTRKMGAGTLPYMSPEMFRDPTSVTYPSDLWSVGVTLFELVTGRLPFVAENDDGWAFVIANDMNEEPPSLLDVLSEERRAIFDHNLSKVIAKALQKQVKHRFSSADEMHDAVYFSLVTKGEAIYSVFISYRVASEEPVARLLFDELNHSITPGGHRVTVYYDALRLVEGEDWQEGFSNGLLNSLCMFPLLSYGSTAPMATLVGNSAHQKWDKKPLGRQRLKGTDSDPEDSVLKEFLIALALLERCGAADRSQNEMGILEVAYPILIGRQVPFGHERYPGMENFFDVQGGGGAYPQTASHPTNMSAANFLSERAGVPQHVAENIKAKAVSSAVRSLTGLQGCQLSEIPEHALLELADINLTREQKSMIGKGFTGPSDDDNHGNVFNEEQLRMVKVLIRYRRKDFHAVIDRAVNEWAMKRSKELEDLSDKESSELEISLPISASMAFLRSSDDGGSGFT